MIEWNKLRSIGNSPAAKSAIAVPILGYFLLFNDEIVKVLRLHTDLCGSEGCKMLWRLQCLYFGGVAFAVGAILYGWQCPPMVKKYKDSSDYLLGERELLDAHVNGRLRDVLVDSKGAGEVAAKSEIRIAALRSIDQADEHNLTDRQRSQLKTATGVGAYDWINTAGCRWRTAVAVCYVIGSVLIAVPSVWTFVDILFRMVRRWVI